jgi:hypothetical protein
MFRPRLCHHYGGITYVGSSRVEKDGKPIGPGLLVIGPDGSLEFVPGPGEQGGWPFHQEAKPLVFDGGRSIWIPPAHSGEPAQVQLVSIARKSVVASPPGDRFHCLHAVTGDGTVFLSRNRQAPLIAFRPGGAGPAGGD